MSDHHRSLDAALGRAGVGAGVDHDAAFAQVTHNADVLWEAIKNTTLQAVDSAYGTDPRHGILARAVADEVAFGKPLPWGLARHFGRDIPPTQPEATP